MTQRVPGTVRVATWNVWWRFAHPVARLSRIHDTLRVLDADVIGLQEVWQLDETHQAAQLAAGLGLSWEWAPSPQSRLWQARLPAGDPGSRALIGLAVLSRWPLLSPVSYRLPAGDGPDEGRLALAVDVEAPGGRLPFVTTQLASSPARSAVRVEQVVELARIVAARRGGPDVAYPPVLCGDFNAALEADEMRLLEGHLTAPAVPGQVLVNAWRYHDGPPPPTWDPRNPYAAATFEPPATIDHILVGPPGEDGRGRVLSCRRFADAPLDSGWASDHTGVTVDLAGETS